MQDGSSMEIMDTEYTGSRLRFGGICHKAIGMGAGIDEFAFDSGEQSSPDLKGHGFSRAAKAAKSSRL